VYIQTLAASTKHPTHFVCASRGDLPPAATTTVATIAPTTSTAAALRLRTSFVHVQRASP